MKILKILIFLIVLLAAVFFITPYFLAENIIVIQTEDINAKSETIFRQVNNLKNWQNWSPFEADPTMKNKYDGPEQGVGAKRSWDGEDAGQGSTTIIKSDPYTYIQNKLLFGPDGGEGIGSWNIEKTENGAIVTWTIHVQDLEYPTGKWIGLLIEMDLSPKMAQGLKDLKTYAEKLPQPPDVKIIEFDAQPSMVIYDSATIDQFEGIFKMNYEELLTYIGYWKVAATGPPFAIYHNWNPEGYTRISVGVPVDSAVKEYKRISYLELPECKAIFARHIGGKNSAAEHYAIDDFMKDLNLERRDFIWESYLYYPETDADSTKWTTFIYYPLK